MGRDRHRSRLSWMGAVGCLGLAGATGAPLVSAEEVHVLAAASLTDALIEYQKVERWNGTVPQVQSGDTMYPIIDIGQQEQEQ